MASSTNFLKEDWNTTAFGEQYNDNAVLTLFELFAHKENLVNSLVFDFLDRKPMDVARFLKRFKPSVREPNPWFPGLTSTSLDEPWMVFPINVYKSHWVCVLRTTVFTSPTTQRIQLFYADSVQCTFYEDRVKELLSETPLFPRGSAVFSCEWTRIDCVPQRESECGARACLHGFLFPLHWIETCFCCCCFF